jgi:hypothetical protein
VRRRPDEIVVTLTPAGSLARKLFLSERCFLDAEHELEELLDSLYGRTGWQDFSAGDDAIDVYGVVESDAAVATLFLAGFLRVVQHEHQSREFQHCSCRSRHCQ